MRIQIAGTLAGVALLASCSGGGASAENALTEADKSRIADEWRNCLSESGLEGELVFADGGFSASMNGGTSDLSDEAMLEIETKCEAILEDLENDGEPELSPEEEAELADASFELADCLADLGYVVVPGQDGIDMNSADQPDDFDEAEYAEAEKTCEDEVLPGLAEESE